MNVLCMLAVVGTASNKAELIYIWDQATPEGKAVIIFLILFSIMAWSVMTSKAIQMRRAKKLNQFFNTEYRTQKNVLEGIAPTNRRVTGTGITIERFVGDRMQETYTNWDSLGLMQQLGVFTMPGKTSAAGR